MSKPASGTGLDTGNSLYSHLTAAGSAVWGMLEGSGTTSADSSGNGHTLTLNTSGSGVTWTTIASDPALAFAGAATVAAAVTSGPALAGTSSWSLAFRGKVTTAFINAGVVCKGNANGYAMFRDGNYFRFAADSSTLYNFTSGPSDFTADHDYLLVYDQPGAKLHLYQDGAEVTGSPLSVLTNDAAFTVNNLGGSYDDAGTFPLIGTMTYAYLMAGYAASSTDASNLHTNPYSIFSSGGGGAALDDEGVIFAWTTQW